MLAVMSLCAFSFFQQQPAITIAAAADLKFAMDSIIASYKPKIQVLKYR